MKREIKEAVLTKISNGMPFISIGKSKFRIEDAVVHVRFCSTNVNAPEKYKFNINPNTLSADYELWICGNTENYYLMPIYLIREIYDNPSTYIDRRHPEIRVVSIDIERHTVTYAAGGVNKNLKPYLGVRIK